MAMYVCTTTVDYWFEVIFTLTIVEKSMVVRIFFVWVMGFVGECSNGLGFIEMLCPASGLECEKSTDRARMPYGVVMQFQFECVVYTLYYFQCYVSNRGRGFF